MPVNINIPLPHLRGLWNQVFANVAASRPEYDLQIFADNTSQLLRVLSRENEQTKALSPTEISQYREQLMEIAHQPAREIEQGYGFGV